MATPIILPKQGNSVETCILVRWLKQVGDEVAEGEPLCEVETDKTTVEIESTVAGVLLEQFAQADDDVPVMTAIAVVGAVGEDVTTLRPGDGGAQASGDAAPVDSARGADPVVAAPAAVATTTSPVPGAGSSPRARELAARRGIDIHTIPGSGPGGLVIERDVPEGPALTPAARAALGPDRVPPARGSGPGGRVRAGDLHQAVAQSSAALASQAAPVVAGSSETIAVKGVRKVIAERMRASLASTAQLTLHAVARVDALQAWRARIKEQGEALGIPKLSVNDLLLFAVSRVLPRFPALNAHFLGDRIVRYADVHLGVAVDTDKGLLVPVLRDANHKSVAQIASELRPLAAACQAGKADTASLAGGTFTVTNLGVLGVEHFTPVLNAPEVAILGVGGIVTRPARQADGSVAFHDVIHLSLTIDHQALDGAPAARFLAALIDAIEHIELLLAS